jgi:stress response protein SCP2
MAQIVVNAMPITNYGASNIVVNAVPIQAKTMSIAEVKGKDLSETKEELTTDGSSGHDYRIGLSWDFADKDGDGKGDTDLDLSAICLDAEGRFKGACYFAEMRQQRRERRRG